MEDLIYVFVGVLIGTLIKIFVIRPIEERKARKECIESGLVSKLDI